MASTKIKFKNGWVQIRAKYLSYSLFKKAVSKMKEVKYSGPKDTTGHFCTRNPITLHAFVVEQKE